jgi:5'-nucleotidase (lipoprotein e(P4) family)
MNTATRFVPSRSRASASGLTCLLFVFVLASACRTAQPVAPAAAPPAPAPRAVAGQAAPAVSEPDSIIWVRQSAEYYALVLQAYRAATARIELLAPTRATGSWAVILDADETVISNVTYQRERALAGLGFTPESWKAWVARRAATPLPGAAAFLRRTRELGGRIAIVTNRLASECPDTEAVFRAHGLEYDVMLCRPDGSPSDKQPRFRAVADGTTTTGLPPVEVVAWIGDNILDFPGLKQAARQAGDAAFAEVGVRFFVLPNPMYGSWQ